MDADGTIHPHYLTVQFAATTDALARLANDPTQPATVRDHAARELTLLDHGQPSAELVKAAQAAVARATNARPANQSDDNGDASSTGRPRLIPVKQYGLRAFLSTTEEMDGWWQHYDPAEIAAGLTEPQWQHVRANLDGSIAFIDDIAAARDAAARTEHAHDKHDAELPPHAACF